MLYTRLKYKIHKRCETLKNYNYNVYPCDRKPVTEGKSNNRVNYGIGK